MNTQTSQTRQAAPLLMGILNVTPDSFSDGGLHESVEAAVTHGLAMAREGAGIIDVGGESTRPGSERVSADEQINRIAEPIRQLRTALDTHGFEQVTISIDTTLSAVAEPALDAGAGMLNDVSAGREDPRMFTLAAKHGVPIALMHMLGQPGTMQDDPQYGDVVEEVLAFLHERAEAAQAAGVAQDKVWIDPGVGFGKTLDHNLALLGALGRFVATGYPVLLGVSRKRFIAGCMERDAPPPELAAEPSRIIPGTDTSGGDRLAGTLAANLIGVQAGVAGLRVHDVAAHWQALAVHQAVRAQQA